MTVNPKNSPPAGSTTINLSDIADRYLDVYQRLFDIAGFLGTAAGQAGEEPFKSFRQTHTIMPKAEGRMEFASAKQAASHWLARSILSEALSTITPLLEDSRMVLALCDYKAAGKTDEDKIKRITGKDRQEFMSLEIPDKLNLLKDKFKIDPEHAPHLIALSGITRDLIMSDGRATRNHVLKISALTLSPAPAVTPSEPPVGKSGQLINHERTINSGSMIELSQEELVGCLVTIASFLATLMEQVQSYARKVGADESVD